MRCSRSEGERQGNLEQATIRRNLMLMRELLRIVDRCSSPYARARLGEDGAVDLRQHVVVRTQRESGNVRLLKLEKVPKNAGNRRSGFVGRIETRTADELFYSAVSCNGGVIR